jgi:hypothetical protein
MGGPGVSFSQALIFGETHMNKNDRKRFVRLYQRLGEAINKTITESESIPKALAELKAAGFEVNLVTSFDLVYCKKEDNTRVDVPLANSFQSVGKRHLRKIPVATKIVQ